MDAGRRRDRLQLFNHGRQKRKIGSVGQSGKVWTVRVIAGRDETGKAIYHNRGGFRTKRAAVAYLEAYIRGEDPGAVWGNQ
jgi:hypothetical protein